MGLGEWLERIVRWVTGRPAVVVAVVCALAAGGAIYAAATLQASDDVGALVGRTSAAAQGTERYHQRFGDEAVYVLVRERLVNLVDTDDLFRLLKLEGCLSGKVPAGATPYGGKGSACGRLAGLRAVQAVYGPATFLNATISQLQDTVVSEVRGIGAKQRSAANAARKLAKAKGKTKDEQERLARAASELVMAQAQQQLLQIATKYGISANLRFGDPASMNQIVFDPELGPEVPKARFSSMFPSSNAAIVQVRLKPGLSETRRHAAVQAIKDATRMADFRLQRGKPYVVTGAPVVLSDLTGTVGESVVVLLIGALLVMALVLMAVFRTRLRLLPLLVALTASGLVFGGAALVGASLTMASIAVLPILIGLGVDYAIQLQSRHDELRAGGERDARAAAREAARRGGPAVAVACLATAAGFLVLLLSPVPMVRGFGLLLVAGVLVALACALTVGSSALSLAGGRRETPGGGGPQASRTPRVLRGPAAALAAAGRGAAEIGSATAGAVGRAARAATPAFVVRGARRGGDRIGAWWRAALRTSVQRPATVLGAGILLAVLGLVAGTQTRVVSDLQKLVPQSSPAVRDLEALQRATGLAGEVDVLVESKRLTDPAVVQWMVDYQKTMLAKTGYSSESGCGKAALCPALSLGDLFGSDARGMTKAKITGVLDALPPYLAQAAITPDRRTAALTFGIRNGSLEEQKQTVDAMRRELDPPPGVRAQVIGLPVLTADANAAVSSDWRRLLTLVAGLAAVGLVLLLVLRRWERALVPLVPIALASGWSALLLFLSRVPLNPMSITLGTLVIAISTEFSVLLSERFREERAAGHDRHAALDRTYRSTGRAVLASGTTAIAGFAVLMLSDIRMLRDFGAVTVIDLAVSLLGVLIVLPAALVLADERELHRLPLRALQQLWAAVPRPRRRTGTVA